MESFEPKYYAEILEDHKINYQNKGVDFFHCYKSTVSDNINCEPTLKRTFLEIFDNIQVKKEWIFLDCGSGLGHAMYLASNFFENIYGIECEMDIAAKSRENLNCIMPRNIKYEVFCSDIKKIISNVGGGGSV